MADSFTSMAEWRRHMGICELAGSGIYDRFFPVKDPMLPLKAMYLTLVTHMFQLLFSGLQPEGTESIHVTQAYIGIGDALAAIYITQQITPDDLCTENHRKFRVEFLGLFMHMMKHYCKECLKSYDKSDRLRTNKRRVFKEAGVNTIDDSFDWGNTLSQLLVIVFPFLNINTKVDLLTPSIACIQRYVDAFTVKNRITSVHINGSKYQMPGFGYLYTPELVKVISRRLPTSLLEKVGGTSAVDIASAVITQGVAEKMADVCNHSSDAFNSLVCDVIKLPCPSAFAAFFDDEKSEMRNTYDRTKQFLSQKALQANVLTAKTASEHVVSHLDLKQARSSHHVVVKDNYKENLGNYLLSILFMALRNSTIRWSLRLGDSVDETQKVTDFERAVTIALSEIKLPPGTNWTDFFTINKATIVEGGSIHSIKCGVMVEGQKIYM